jgi:hypothetical protein
MNIEQQAEEYAENNIARIYYEDDGKLSNIEKEIKEAYIAGYNQCIKDSETNIKIDNEIQD